MKSNNLIIAFIIVICASVYIIFGMKTDTSSVENRLTSSGFSNSDYILDIERDLKALDVDNLLIGVYN